ncbi:MAG: class II aldolase/adducin family protein [Ignisphaera sp.]|uniref:Class II aldolase/adducin N-terminal domain-containing protein n=1 Tax=Ignisphaera aggregans TaxID=334771 RepID=A0A7C4JJR5_9CREN
MSLDELKRTFATQICEALHLIYLKGLITPLTGNISIKVGDTILITPSSFFPMIRLKYELKLEDIVEVDLSGKVLKGGTYY